MRREAFRCQFALVVRYDDAEILHEAREVTGVGKIYVHGRLNGRFVSWNVSNQRDCLGLIEYLDRYYLRAKKARDYEIWREAVLAWTAPGPRRGFGRDWSRVAELSRRLIEGRRPAPKGV